MRIIFCGTGAAEGIPCAFCTCRVCREAARLGGKDLRTRFSIQVGERLRVDWPPDSHAHMLRHATGYKLAGDGHDTRSIQDYLGHKNIQHTVRYTELSPTRFKDFWRD